MNAALQHTYNCAEHGSPEVHGVGNYTIPLYDSHGKDTAAVLYFFDSGRESEHPAVPGYDWIRRDQIRWYEMASLAYSAKHQGNPLPALAFSISLYRSIMKSGSGKRATGASSRECAVPK